MIREDQVAGASATPVALTRRVMRPRSDLDDEAPGLVITADGPDDIGRLTVVVTGEIDHSTTGVLQAHLLTRLGQPHVRELVLDLSGVTFLNAGGLTAIAAVRSRAGQAAVRLVLRCGEQRAVLRPLQITGLLEFFDLEVA